MPFSQSFVRPHTKKRSFAHGDCQEFSFLYWRTLKRMKQKRFSGNVVHLFLRLSILLHQVSKKQRRKLRRMKKNGVAPDATAKQKRRNFKNS